MNLLLYILLDVLLFQPLTGRAWQVMAQFQLLSNT